MRRNFYLVWALLVVFASGCSMDNEESEYYQYTLGVVEGNSASTFMIFTDGGERLRPVEFQPTNYEIEEGKRVLARYSVIEESDSETYDYSVKLASISNVLTKQIVVANEEVRDTIGNDPVTINWLSIGNGYLNVDFAFWADSEPHYFDLVLDSTKQDKEGFITLNFHHNAKEDIKYMQYSGLISFPLEMLEDDAADSVKLLFTSKKEDNSIFTKELEYKYGEEE
ncbi:NigD1/NigD2 family lipoprotein [Geofilum rubicundum]|uniref:NigD-like C-terminal beta sandwich domain-containing protein n=1 Tax=Geofilum rubicundum JCM 15548 TaxID=1236989 RepID=A0A0E9LVC1_9BACT|nr:NigD-like C-terminal domain-containing protein [Geofilum rubicundum]GAO28820.1 hypothetical protein JCM15548_1952 [Geofilum rubicundum JCM 15548]